ncbi:reverse transcriptase domain-containing protein [Puia sp. P3]|uniref:reverse transcriptase domain-containing protein n=1 Tax=Puia sp. P3 TaxID=3423952 RepID=UPI003D666C6A
MAHIRKYYGIEAFFESIMEFKKALKNKEISVYKHPFVKNGKPVGIPQGLPISANLANLYLLEFDKEILKEIVNASGGFYRRYSDDILVICRPNQADYIESFIHSAITKSEVKISKEKTEKYLFKPFQISPTKKGLLRYYYQMIDR